MKFSKAALFILMTFFMQQNIMAQSYFKKEYPHVWQRSADYILEVAAAMPADKYSFKPTEESMSFHAQLTHLAQNLSFLSAKITGDRPDFLNGKDPEKLSKEEICMVLGEAFGYVDRLIEAVDDQKLQEEIEFGGVKMSKENIFYLMRDHATHHRAQAILYLRMNGVEAPRYRGW
jgi:uncharacterized damage-inducible protein DinB